MVRRSVFSTQVSHRSGETEDSEAFPRRADSFHAAAGLLHCGFGRGAACLDGTTTELAAPVRTRRREAKALGRSRLERPAAPSVLPSTISCHLAEITTHYPTLLPLTLPPNNMGPRTPSDFKDPYRGGARQSLQSLAQNR